MAKLQKDSGCWIHVCKLTWPWHWTKLHSVLKLMFLQSGLFSTAVVKFLVVNIKFTFKFTEDPFSASKVHSFEKSIKGLLLSWSNYLEAHTKWISRLPVCLTLSANADKVWYLRLAPKVYWKWQLETKMAVDLCNSTKDRGLQAVCVSHLVSGCRCSLTPQTPNGNQRWLFEWKREM